MAIVVEDGTGLAGAETYLSVADADSYHASLGQTAWTGTDAAKEAALRKGSRYLDARYQRLWNGQRVNGRDQGLMWPRYSATDVEGWPVASDAVPVEVERAAAEAALRELEDPGSLSPDVTNSAGGTVIREKVGPLEVEYAEGSTGRLRPLVQVLDDILAPLLGGGATGSFGSLGIVRG